MPVKVYIEFKDDLVCGFVKIYQNTNLPKTILLLIFTMGQGFI